MLQKNKLMNAVSLGYIDQEGSADAIDALKPFIDACVRKGQTAAYLPGVPGNKKGYRFRSRPIWDKPKDGLLIPPGFTLVGDGPTKTKFFQDPASFDGRTIDWPSYSFIFYSTRSSLQGLGFDGQRHLIKNGAETSFTSCFVKAAEPQCREAVFKDLYMTGNVGGIAESFCLQTSMQEDGTLFERVRCDHNNGSGISCNGDMLKERAAPGTGLNRHIRVLDCAAQNNTWQGITFYGCQDSLLANFRGVANGSRAHWGGSGANFEWTYRMHVAGGDFRDNIGGGIGGFGDNDGLLIDGQFVIEHNNLLASDKGGEISFSKGSWWNQQKGPLTGMLRTLTIKDGRISPAKDRTGGGGCHLNVDLKDAGEVTYPHRGPARLPTVSAIGVKDLTQPTQWRLTAFTDRAGLHVLP